MPSSSVVMPSHASTTNKAMSVLFKTCRVFWTRSAPNSPSSSNPGVSIITTGPSGKSSIAFWTGSVVVPLTSETMARLCPVSALTRLDLPALRRPKIPICVRLAEGVVFKLMINVSPLESEIPSVVFFNQPQVFQHDVPRFFIRDV